jgi:hypothetical protein
MTQSPEAWKAYVEARHTALARYLDAVMPTEEVDLADLEKRETAADAAHVRAHAEAWQMFMRAVANRLP